MIPTQDNLLVELVDGNDDAGPRWAKVLAAADDAPAVLKKAALILFPRGVGWPLGFRRYLLPASEVIAYDNNEKAAAPEGSD